ncbi:MAG: hypothetical protein A3I75_05270 [Deltaproteobacteria bacterium RIFCSPLOWO2_02_FULL_50_16]|nr:MAG: hypothetical protein A3B79_05675 [Deltaproteobacteria bacterium RIFCSPHIGHO2_02_FULL_50_15]OGQ57689.1 MAG: hypothetical protein A3I75_05270 [Deltaproteobacteria bacterium RIFCSPLOWO2_02_FULL_50_16]OGQ68453.1 MAG: hypothetical protein A3F89_04155 [Deltaproteobacteria bacterium RIFCSPLOWO2_12_FULL_50_11]
MKKLFMQKAIDIARQGLRRGQSPFGAVIVKKNRIVSLAHNKVRLKNDCTAHAEIVALRQACQDLKTIHLDDCEMYSTCEPCPMCFAALHWARIKKIYFGVPIRIPQKYGFNELCLSNQRLKTLAKAPIKIYKGLLHEECETLFQEWKTQWGGKPY